MSVADLIANVVKPWLPIRVWNCTVDNVLSAAQSAVAALTVSTSLTFSAGMPAAGPNALLSATSASPSAGAVVWVPSQGTWTPTLLFGGSAAGITLTQVSAWWGRFGTNILLYATFNVAVIPAATAVQATIGGLPVVFGTQNQCAIDLWLDNFGPVTASTTGYRLQAGGGPGSAVLAPFSVQGGLNPSTAVQLTDTQGATGWKAGNPTGGTVARISGWYSAA